MRAKAGVTPNTTTTAANNIAAMLRPETRWTLIFGLPCKRLLMLRERLENTNFCPETDPALLI